MNNTMKRSLLLVAIFTIGALQVNASSRRAGGTNPSPISVLEFLGKLKLEAAEEAYETAEKAYEDATRRVDNVAKKYDGCVSDEQAEKIDAELCYAMTFQKNAWCKLLEAKRKLKACKAS